LTPPPSTFLALTPLSKLQHLGLQFSVSLESLELREFDEGSAWKAWSMNFKSDEAGELGA